MIKQKSQIKLIICITQIVYLVVLVNSKYIIMQVSSRAYRPESRERGHATILFLDSHKIVISNNIAFWSTLYIIIKIFLACGCCH